MSSPRAQTGADAANQHGPAPSRRAQSPRPHPGERAVCLVSGGLDSATVLAIARREHELECIALSFDYGQRHRVELQAAGRLAASLGAEHRVLTVDLRAVGGSALTDGAIGVPEHRSDEQIGSGIPVTYVPARNLLFLSLALGVAEVEQARHLFMGVNAVDYSGYPDCRPAFVEAFERVANLATRVGVEEAEHGRSHFCIHTPLIELTKAQIIARGAQLGVDYSRTVSCYQPDDDGRACGVCDSCHLRRRGFADAGLSDPTRYAADA